MTTIAGLECVGLNGLRGPLAFIEAVPGLSFHDQVELIASDGRVCSGRVLELSEHAAVIEIFGATDGLALDETRLRFHGSPLRLGVGPELLGRIFDGLGRPRDGLPPPLVVEERPIEGAAINPCRREYPRDFLETGVSAIDLLTSVVLGQKLPIFTEAGLPHDTLALQIVRQTRAPGVEAFAIVFAALGLPRAVALRYEEAFRTSGALGRMMAQEGDAELTILHAFEWAEDERLTTRPFSVPEYRQDVERSATAKLQALVPDSIRDWCRPSTRLGHGKAYREILAVAIEDRADLIVMGVHGRNALDLMLFGSTTNQVVRRATCPVLTLRR